MRKPDWRFIALIIDSEPLMIDRRTRCLLYAAVEVTAKHETLSYTLGVYAADHNLSDMLPQDTGQHFTLLPSKYWQVSCDDPRFQMRHHIRQGTLPRYVALQCAVIDREKELRAPLVNAAVERFKTIVERRRVPEGMAARRQIG